MNEEPIRFPVRLRLVPEQADGSNCIGCGDTPYIHTFKFALELFGEQIPIRDMLLCEACAELVRAELNTLQK